MNITRGFARFRLREHVRTSLWFLPGLIVAAAAVAALLLIAAEPRGGDPSSPLVFGGGAESAREVLSTIAGSMVAFVGTVFSITVLVLQLASSQFSPRALRTFLRDRRSQVPLGIFLGTLVYSLIVLWSVRSTGGEVAEFVPRIAMTGAAVLVLGSLVLFVYYIDHVAQSIRVATVVHRIGEEMLEVLEDRYPHPFDPALQPPALDGDRGHGALVASETGGILLAVDVDSAMQLGRDLDCRIEIVPFVGEYVPMGAPLAYVVGSAEASSVLELVALGRERTMDQDISFGLRQLVDIAEKALSPAINDPTTASQAFDQIHNVLRQLAHRAMPDEVVRDEHGVARLIGRERTWDELVQLGFGEILDYAQSSRQMRARVRVALEDLADSVPTERTATLGPLFARVSDDPGALQAPPPD